MPGLDERSLQQSATWSHLKQVVSGIIHERPNNAVAALEARSTKVVTGNALPPQVRTVYQDTVSKSFRCLVPPTAASETEFASRYADQSRPIKKKKKPVEDEEDVGDEYDEEEEDLDAEEKGQLSDVEAEQALLREFGVGLTEIDAHRIFVSLKKLLDAEPLGQVRFWGKISGTQRDYFIAEAKIDDNRVEENEDLDEEEPEEDFEGKPADTIHRGINKHLAKPPPKPPAEQRQRYGSINEYVYYVCTDDERTNWTRLPDALPTQIVAASQINKLFTGNLTSSVNTHPAFPGEERHYLRAQIARITHACTASPKDNFSTEGAVPEDDDDDLELPEHKRKPKRFDVPAYEEVPPLNETEAPDAEDNEGIAPIKEWFNGFSANELLDPKFWVHIRSTILPDGKTTTFNPEDVEPTGAAAAGLDEGDEDLPEDIDPPAAPTVYINPFLSDLAHDKSIKINEHSLGEVPAWTVRKAPSATSAVFQRYLLRSAAWPGAVTYAETEVGKPGAQYQNCYFGRGVKTLVGGASAVAPALPPLMSVEFPASHLKLQRDCTRDDEAEYEPMPEEPTAPEDEEEEEDNY